MITLYCRKNHRTAMKLCGDCDELLAYASRRVDMCPFITNKPTCANCTAHCYEKSKGEKIRAVMRFSGPRMLTRHPVLAVLHMVDDRRQPRKPRKKA